MSLYDRGICGSDERDDNGENIVDKYNIMNISIST
jgi:hypothetical protein